VPPRHASFLPKINSAAGSRRLHGRVCKRGQSATLILARRGGSTLVDFFLLKLLKTCYNGSSIMVHALASGPHPNISPQHTKENSHCAWTAQTSIISTNCQHNRTRTAPATAIACWSSHRHTSSHKILQIRCQTKNNKTMLSS
jgi:hypothetical protein